ncbi:MAG: hypothetical protein HYV63_21060 [Candidatus Schekmanbacteria bacterium]|nr:hypothetical protein [Candidatus Schekmanbacteria bacterium]
MSDGDAVRATTLKPFQPTFKPLETPTSPTGASTIVTTPAVISDSAAADAAEAARLQVVPDRAEHLSMATADLQQLESALSTVQGRIDDATSKLTEIRSAGRDLAQASHGSREDIAAQCRRLLAACGMAEPELSRLADLLAGNEGARRDLISQSGHKLDSETSTGGERDIAVEGGHQELKDFNIKSYEEEKFEGYKKQLAATGMTEPELSQKARMMAMQAAQQMMTEIVTMLSNIMKAKHEAMMAIIRNLK